MKARVYLETTVPSYYTAWPSRDLVVAAHQQITHEWWRTRLQDFEVCISQFVLDEAAEGDPEAARLRLDTLRPFQLLEVTDDALALAKDLVASGAVPVKAAQDAAHIAMAAAHGIHFLLTWNCRHMANAEIIEQIEACCRRHDFACPVICTPEELLGV